MKAVIYTRVSTDVQVDTGHSLDMQRDRLESYCKAYNLEIADVLVDEGISGGIPLHKRPQGSKLVEMARKKEITHVVAYSLTRLFRDVVDGLTNIEKWTKQGISVVLLDVGGQAVDTSSAMGKLMIGLLLQISAMERHVTGERVKAVLDHKKSNGEVYTGSKYGFDRLGDQFIPNEDETLGIHKIKQYRQSGLSLQKITNQLNSENIPSKKGTHWHKTQVARVLRYADQ